MVNRLVSISEDGSLAPAAKVRDANLPAHLTTASIGATIADIGGTVFSPSSASSFDAAQNVVYSTIGSDPIPLDAIGDYIYGSTSNALYRATSHAGPWTLIKDFGTGAGINGIRLLGNGEMLLIRSQDGLWRSTGWATNPATATWAQVLVTNGRTTQFSIDVDPVSGWVAATTYINGDMTNSRYVWLSKNHGGTFTQIFDMAAHEPTVNQAHAHMHIAALDPFHNATTPRIWISYHKTTDDPTNAASPMAKIKYSDNGGTSWVNFSNSVYQPVAAIATPDGMLFGSDENVVGIYIVRRATASNMRYELFHAIRKNIDGMFGWATRAIRGLNGAVYFTFRSSVAGFGAHVIATDGRHVAEVLEIPAPSGENVDLVDLTEYKGKITGVYYQSATSSTARKFIADTPKRGVAKVDRRGGVDGGVAQALGTAVGLAATAEMRGLATGSNTVAGIRAVAVGEQARAVMEGTTIGSEANTTGTGTSTGRLSTTADGVANGNHATAAGDGTAVGAWTNSVTQSVAVGSFAAATGPTSVSIGRVAEATEDSAVAVGFAADAKATGATAVGTLAAANHQFSMALGYGATTTAGNQVALGAKTLYLRNAPAVPEPIAGAGVLYIEGGALKFRGGNGTITTIASA